MRECSPLFISEGHEKIGSQVTTLAIIQNADITLHEIEILIGCVLIMRDQWRTQEFCSGRGGSINSVEDRGQRQRGSGGGSPLVMGSGGSCNLVQEFSFHIVKFS